ncbi:MAG: ATP-binding cassette domain-containing protein, partial [Deltaproteobacteria bacterium]|nr:ATP-binding cassette domain-containing protein [Deltaproteobacteria bacterium]
MIKAQELTKFFGRRKAVDRVSFVVEKGEILGFLGPNGAGKSTTMRMLTGFIPPSSGTALVDGHDVTRNSLAARELMGYLPENAPVYPEMTVTGFLHFIARIRGFDSKKERQKV